MMINLCADMGLRIEQEAQDALKRLAVVMIKDELHLGTVPTPTPLQAGWLYGIVSEMLATGDTVLVVRNYPAWEVAPQLEDIMNWLIEISNKSEDRRLLSRQT